MAQAALKGPNELHITCDCGDLHVLRVKDSKPHLETFKGKKKGPDNAARVSKKEQSGLISWLRGDTRDDDPPEGSGDSGDDKPGSDE